MSQKAAVSKGASSKGACSSGKSKGSHPSKQSRPASKSRVTEADLLRKHGDISPEDVLSLEVATEGE